MVGAILAAALVTGLAGLILWVRRKRRQDAVRDLGTLGALPNVSAESISLDDAPAVCQAPHLLG